MRCVTCGDTIHPDRVEHGYDYCVQDRCVQENFTGIRVVEVGVNKSAAQIVAAGDVQHALDKTRDGEYDRRGTTLGATSGNRSGAAPRRGRRVAAGAKPSRAKRWTPQQEKAVKVFHEMGLTPREMIERAPHLALTTSLITEIVCSFRP